MQGRALVFSAPPGEVLDLKTAIERGDERAVRRFATALVVDAEDLADHMTPLMRAVSCQREPIADLLLDLGADVNVQASSSETALYLALKKTLFNMVISCG